MGMKWLASLMLVFAGLLLAGCVHHKPTHPATVVAKPAPTIVTPDYSLAGKVVSYNEAGRFVVLNFPTGQMPKMDQHFSSIVPD